MPIKRIKFSKNYQPNVITFIEMYDNCKRTNHSTDLDPLCLQSPCLYNVGNQKLVEDGKNRKRHIIDKGNDIDFHNSMR